MITVILPVHEFNNDIKRYLSNALQSVNRQLNATPSVVLVYAAKIEAEITAYKEAEPELTSRVTLLKNEGNFDFQSQVNLGVSKITTDYFSILELDDEYSEIYFRNAEIHIKAYPDLALFLPITIQTDKYGKGISLINDAAWSRDFAGDDGEQGYLSFESILKFSTFNLTGGVFKKSSFLEVGGFKKSIKLTFWYEYILRMLNFGQKAMVIPKVGYKHVVDREDSLFVSLTTMLMNERKFWFETAKKEYYFIEDRVIDTSAITTTQ